MNGYVVQPEGSMAKLIEDIPSPCCPPRFDEYAARALRRSVALVAAMCHQGLLPAVRCARPLSA
jgi:hypothetical protein